MKITKEFAPMTITLEKQEELEILLLFLHYAEKGLNSYHFHFACKEKDLYERLQHFRKQLKC